RASRMRWPSWKGWCSAWKRASCRSRNRSPPSSAASRWCARSGSGWPRSSSGSRCCSSPRPGSSCSARSRTTRSRRRGPRTLPGGKRIRPVLALAAGEACGAPARRVLPFACALEMIHTYSLVHDDLPAMDDDDLRRGQPTSHKVWGEGLAILVGDALLTEAFRVMAGAPGVPPARTLGAVAEVAAAAGEAGMVGGQALDLVAEGS